MVLLSSLDVCSVGPGSVREPGPFWGSSHQEVGLALFATGGSIPLIPKKEGFTCFGRH